MVCLDVIFDTAQQKIQESMQLGTWKTLQSSLCRKGIRHALMRTGTQTRRMAEAGRDLWVHLVLLLCRQSHQQQVSQAHIHTASEHPTSDNDQHQAFWWMQYISTVKLIIILWILCLALCSFRKQRPSPASWIPDKFSSLQDRWGCREDRSGNK